MIDRDEAGGPREAQRECEKLSVRGGRKAGTLKNGVSRNLRDYIGRSALVCLVCTVTSDTGWTLRVRVRVGRGYE